MTTKVNGAAYPGVWVERDTAFIRVTFSESMLAVAAGDLSTISSAGTDTVTTAVAQSTFDVVESAIVQALKWIQQRATVLAVSSYDTSTFSFDVLLGHAEGWFAPSSGVIASAVPLFTAGLNVVGKVTTAGTSNNPAKPVLNIGDSVYLKAAMASTFNVDFLAFTGGLPTAASVSALESNTEVGGAQLPGTGFAAGATYQPFVPNTVA